MKKYLFIGSLLLASFAKAQLVNNGATIVVQTGATLFCAGSFTNTSGTITNDGKIEVQGNFANSGTYNSTTSDDSLILSGSGNATLSAGGASFRYLTINKPTPTDVVTLASTITVLNKLDFLSGGLSTDYLVNPSYSVTAPVTAVFNFLNGSEIVGNVKRTGWGNGSMVPFNGANMQLTTNGGTAPADITATMLPGGDPSQNEREVKRKFLFTPTGGSGYTADVRFPYLATELNVNSNFNLESNLVPWNLVAAEWNARLTPVTRGATSASSYVSTTGIDAASFAQEWKLADPRYTFNVTAYLRGPWNGTDMNTGINSILPTTQPYNTTPFNYNGIESVGSIPSTDVIDWVLVELRKPSSGLGADATLSTLIGRKAVFLSKNGTILDLNGSNTFAFDISKQGSGNFIVVRHRNHLGVMSNAMSSNVAGTFANDFSLLANSYKAAGSSSDPMTSLNGIKYGLWPGDANGNGVININDVNLVKLGISSSASGYVSTDINLNGGVNATDINLTKTTISSSGTGSVQNRLATGKVKTNLPDPVQE